jgi:hypothetical protein
VQVIEAPQKPVPLPSSWQRSFFKQDGEKLKCIAPCAAGHTQCTFTTGKNARTCNLQQHLETSAHLLNKNDAAQSRLILDFIQRREQDHRQQRTLTKMISLQKHTGRNLVLNLFREGFLPFAFADRPSMRAIFSALDVEFDRKSIVGAIAGDARTLMAKAAAKLAGQKVTLAIDSGTVWRRYLVVVALTPKYPPVIIGAFEDEVLGGTLNSEAIARALEQCMSVLKASTIVGIVADNAANMQRAMTLVKVEAPPLADPLGDDHNHHHARGDDIDNDEDPLPRAADNVEVRLCSCNVERAPFFFIRCQAHIDQLCVKMIVEARPEIHEDAETARRITRISERVVDTRWNSVHTVIEAALRKHDSLAAARDGGAILDTEEAARIIRDLDLLARLRTHA